jgi:DNA-directed RNA polymerase specialized sigma24 family protein
MANWIPPSLSRYLRVQRICNFSDKAELQDAVELKSNVLEEIQALQQQHGDMERAILELTQEYRTIHVLVRDFGLAEEGASAACDCECCANGYDGGGQPAEVPYGG